MRSILGLFLLLIASPAVAVPLSAERLLSPVTLAPSFFSPVNARVASDGRDFLVVWRNGAARVTAAGEVLDPLSISLPGPESHAVPEVVWDGTRYVICRAIDQGSGRATLHFLGVRGDEFEIFPATIDIPSVSGMRLAWTGASFAVAHRIDATTTGVTYFTLAGTILKTVRLASTVAPAIAVSGTSLHVVLDHSIVELSATGDVVREIALGDLRGMTVASIGDELLAVATERLEKSVRLIAIRMNRAGSVRWNAVLGEFATVLHAEAVFANGDAIVVWRDARAQVWTAPFQSPYSDSDFWLARITENGTVVSNGSLFREMFGRFVPPPAPPALATNGPAALVLTYNRIYVPGQLAGTLFANILLPAEMLHSVITFRTTDQSVYAVTSTPDHDVVVWSEEGTLRATRITSSGEVLDPSGIAIALTSQPMAASAFDGATTVIAWRDELGISIRRMTADGRLDPPVRIPDENPVDLAIAAANGEVLVAWTVGNSYPNRPARFARIAGDRVVEPAVTFGESRGRMSVASDGMSFVIVTNKTVDPGGTILSATHIVGSTWVKKDFVAAPEIYGAPRIVWDGERYLTLWGTSAGARGLRLSREGDPIDGALTDWRGFEVPGVMSVIDLANVGGSVAVIGSAGTLFVDPGSLEVTDSIPIGNAFVGKRIVAYNTSRAVFRRMLSESPRPRAAVH